MLNKDNLKLRIPEPEDIEFILNMENDSSLWNVSNTHNPFSRFDIEQYVLLADKDIYSAKQLRFIIDLYKSSNKEAIGTVDIFDFDAHNKRAGIGISIVAQERRKGYAKTVIEIVTNYLFTHLNLHQIYCNIEEDNSNSIRLFKSLDFQNTGVKKDWNQRNGSWVNILFFQKIL